MKSTFLLLTLTFSLSTCFAQNLVPNPSFEDTIACPQYSGNTSSLIGWEININTVDYFNSCSKSSINIGIPQNAFGFQCPANGNAYVGLYTYIQTNPNSNEFIGTHLSSPLIVGQKYYISFKASLADANPNLMCGVDNLGVLFTNVNYSHIITIPAPVLINKAHVYTSQVIIDTLNWIRICGSFIADSAYNYILIGHFYDNNHTVVECLDSNNTSNRWSYYYIDDVCVSTDSLTCIIPNGSNTCDSTGIVNYLNIENIEIYPNPTSDKLIINLPFIDKYFIRIFSMIDELIYENYFYEKKNILDLSKYPNGLYLIQISVKDKIINKKIIVTN